MQTIDRVTSAELAEMTARVRAVHPENPPRRGAERALRAVARLPGCAKIRRALNARGAARTPVIDTPSREAR